MYAAFAVFTRFPSLAALPAVLFFLLWRWRKKRSAWNAGIAWAVYLVYEYSLKLRILCSGECNIRVDLLLIAPVLLLMSFVALIAAGRKRQ